MGKVRRGKCTFVCVCGGGGGKGGGERAKEVDFWPGPSICQLWNSFLSPCPCRERSSSSSTRPPALGLFISQANTWRQMKQTSLGEFLLGKGAVRRWIRDNELHETGLHAGE